MHIFTERKQMNLIEQITFLIGRAEDYIALQASPAAPAPVVVPVAPAPAVIVAVIPADFRTADAERLNDQDIAAVAQHLGVELAAFRAVILTETRGSGFDHDGRPKMLFEPHIFYRLLAAQKPDALADAVSDDLAYQHWGAEPYPADSYPRLLDAEDVDQELALQSASWGIGQVLGSNHKLGGYDTAVAMVADACASERSQLAQMAAYIAATGLGPALRRRDWAAFAAGYNGRGQVETYAKELADNYHS
jgi:hypothetical protein